MLLTRRSDTIPPHKSGKARIATAPRPADVESTGRDLPPRTLAGRRRDQLTKAPDYGAVLVAISVAQFYLSGMLQRTAPAGFIAPCLPTKTDKLPSGSQWLHEIKHDGFRVIARKDDDRVRLYSRPGNDMTRRFPLIVDALSRLRSRSCIIDGEAVACDDNGVASFDLIRRHRHNDHAFLYAFDLIELNGDDMRRDPLEVRKATLRSMLAKAGLGLRFNEHLEGDGPTVFAHACKMGLEGIVSKRLGSPYRSGRTRHWDKSKNPIAPAVKREGRRIGANDPHSFAPA